MIVSDRPTREVVDGLLAVEQLLNDVLERAAQQGITLCPDFLLTPRTNHINSMIQYHVHIRLPVDDSQNE